MENYKVLRTRTITIVDECHIKDLPDYLTEEDAERIAEEEDGLQFWKREIKTVDDSYEVKEQD
tara:strand:+ start:490 stop:678 length:189 start_codon:yes stop_codon:yes gene_type:complete